MTYPQNQGTPPNWYPDPYNPSQLRYFDGQRWTEHVQAHVQQPYVPAKSGPLVAKILAIVIISFVAIIALLIFGLPLLIRHSI